MKDDHDFRKFKDIVIDTGPLLILLTGFYGHGVKKFTKEKDDFKILVEFIKKYPNIFVTPQVLTEVSNLAKREFGDYFEDFMNFSTKHILRFDEKYIDKNILATKPELKLIKFGFTDSSLIEVATDGKLLLTNDIPLYHYCTNIGITSITIDVIKKYCRLS